MNKNSVVSKTRKHRKNLAGFCITVFGMFFLLSGLIYANTYTVDNLNDTDNGLDYTGGDGTNTVRKCIRLVNAHTGADTINFSVNGTISPTSALPSLTDDYTLITAADRWGGTWPDGSPGDTISGSGAGIGTSGLNLNGANYCQICGLFIRDFKQDGVDIQGGSQYDEVGGSGTGERNIISGNSENGIYITGTNTYYNLVKGNYIGIEADGATALANKYGIEITSANYDTIGGSTDGERNIISGNNTYGVYIVGTGTSNNVVKRNYIGTNKNGASAVANGYGIEISNGAQNNTIGGSTGGERNVISGSTNYGIDIYGSTNRGNVVKGNYIGTDYTGEAALPNNTGGIYIHSGSRNNTIGGSTAAGRNVISGNTNTYGVLISNANTDSNTVKGNYIGVDANGGTKLANTYGIRIDDGAKNNTIGGSTDGDRNIISGNTNYGIWIRDTDTKNNVVKGNYIGISSNGSTKISNDNGVYISNAAQNDTIGGSTDGERNIISGNASSGVVVTGTNTKNNTVKGNYIGIDVSGNSPLDNYRGVTISSSAQSNTIGGPSTGDRNIISGNRNIGVYITGTNTNYNAVRGNYIGVDVNGTSALANYHGVYIENGAQSDTVGGSTGGDRNIISGNTNYGVYIGGAGTNNNVVKGNYLGTDVTGTAKKPNGHGVYIVSGAQNNLIGGSTGGDRNIISGNTSYGIFIGDDNTDNNIIRGNYIGTDITGTANLGNSSTGIRIEGGTQSDTIGGAGSGQSNIIAFNGADGIALAGSATKRHTISTNSFFDNTGLGIDLSDNGVTANDNDYNATEPDSGIDFPIPDTVKINADQLQIAGFVGTSRAIASTNTAFTDCRVEIYKAAVDPTGYGEGKIYLGYLTTGGANSLFSGFIDVSGKGVAAGNYITYLTIDAHGNTSEFGPDSVIGEPTAILVSSFTAEASTNRVTVRWKTEQEINTAGFNLYRNPADTSGYTRLTTALIPAHGDPIVGGGYQYDDPKGAAGDCYKLELVTLSGNSIFFGPVKAETKNLKDAPPHFVPVQFAVMPNPIRTLATVQYYVAGNRQVQLTVYDCNGRQVCRLVNCRQAAGNYRAPWNGETVGPGVYFIALDISGSPRIIKKAVVLK